MKFSAFNNYLPFMAWVFLSQKVIFEMEWFCCNSPYCKIQTKKSMRELYLASRTICHDNKMNEKTPVQSFPLPFHQFPSLQNNMV